MREEEARSSSGFMGLCWNWKLHIWFKILQSVGWSEVGGKEKKEEPLLPAWCDSSFGLLAIDEEGA